MQTFFLVSTLILLSACATTPQRLPMILVTNQDPYSKSPEQIIFEHRVLEVAGRIALAARQMRPDKIPSQFELISRSSRQEPVKWDLAGKLTIDWATLHQANWSEDQLATVLSHDLAHRTLGHQIQPEVIFQGGIYNPIILCYMPCPELQPPLVKVRSYIPDAMEQQANSFSRTINNRGGFSDVPLALDFSVLHPEPRSGYPVSLPNLGGG